ncbi:lipase family protein [Winogradskyella sp. Asnod2-B02-A]|uniref:lipase family protein n=1 Tax=Winogradskyella sp. Asnod2-B02-A TaxID=3160583 RepID=UPI003866AED6
MRVLVSILFLFQTIFSFAQLDSGFNTNEAKQTIAMCNSFNFIKQFDSAHGIIPEGFTLSYTSDVLSMDNKFQVYDNGKVGIINYRGSTNKVISWVENCYSAMIPAKGRITIEGKPSEYAFSNVNDAAVHAGYGLTIVILSETIKAQIKALNSKGIYNIIITGHSQGGALGTLTRAYLEHLPAGELSEKNTYKTYVYAQPMSGNKEFAADYNTQFSDEGTSYSIVNPKDPVPYLPVNYEEETLVTKDKIKGWLFGEEKFSAKELGKNAFIRLFEGGLTSYVKNSNSLMNKILGLQLGKIEMPEFVRDINYYPTGELKEIEAFEYPKIEVDVSDLNEDERKDFTQGDDGKWYKTETKFFQHSVYNYYVGLLKKWDTTSYHNLDMTYLESDL